MKHFLLPLLAGLFVLGCGKYVSQAELDTTTNSLRAELQTSAEQSALGVHECSAARAYAMQSAQVCMLQQMQGVERQNSVACIVLATWQGHCLRTDDEDNLVVPEPGVIDALETILHEAQQNE